MTELERMEHIRKLKADVENCMARISDLVLEAANYGAKFYFEHQTQGESNYLQFCSVIENETPPWCLDLRGGSDPKAAQALIDKIFEGKAH